MDESRVLVLLSTYNGEKYLETQLDSLRKQVGIKVSILVRDDGSKDGTEEILKKYSSIMDLKYLLAENLGSTKSFLELIKNSPLDYEYYAFCDQDDYWHSDKLVTAVQKLSESTTNGPALYCSGQKLVDADLKPIYDHILDAKRNTYANAIFNQMAGCTSVFNRELLECMKRISSINYTPGFHDSALYRVCTLVNGTVVCDPEGKIDYRQHGSNVVGLDYSFKGKVSKVQRYIQPGELIKDLNYIYNNDLSWCDSEKVIFFEHIRKSNKSVKSKLWLLTHQGRIDFHSPVLRGIYNLKIITSKL